MMNCPLEIFDQQVFLPVEIRGLLNVLLVESLRNQVELASLPRLPEVVGHVAEDRLQEQDEADPLVPRVANFVSILSHLKVIKNIFISFQVYIYPG